MAGCGNIPEVTRPQIVSGLRRLGLEGGDGVMVHSSLKSFGRVVGGPGTVIEALMQVLTPAGTLLMPSFNHGRPFRQGGEGYFDPLTTPTANGIIPDTFWRMPGVYRSLSPTHAFAAWGKNARRYTRLHHRTLTMGPDCPLGLLGREGGYSLLIGVGYNVNTYHHVVEVSTGAPCLGRRTIALPVRLPNGRMVEARNWGWRAKSCPINDSARYGRVLRDRGLQRETTIGASRLICFRLSDCFDAVAGLLREGLDDLLPCSRCPIRPAPDPRAVPSDWDDRNQRLLPNSPAWSY